MNALLFSAGRSSARLPWLYVEHDFARPRQGSVWSFEVNGLTQLTAGRYDVRFVVHPGVRQVAHSWDGRSFRTRDARDGFFDVKGQALPHRVLSCYWQAQGSGDEPPVADVLLVPAG